MATPTIESYRFGHIVIDGEAYDQDVIILPDRVIGGWWRKEGHTLRPDDLKAVFEAAPEVLVVGKGASSGMQVADETKQALQEASIKLVASPTGKAVETYNEMRNEQAVAAAFHLTC